MSRLSTIFIKIESLIQKSEQLKKYLYNVPQKSRPAKDEIRDLNQEVILSSEDKL